MVEESTDPLLTGIQVLCYKLLKVQEGPNICFKGTVVSLPTSQVTHINVRVDELSSCISGQHVYDDHLAPLVHVHEQVAQFAVVLVDQVYPLRTHLQSIQYQSCISLFRI